MQSFTPFFVHLLLAFWLEHIFLWTWELFSQITCYVVWYSPLLSICVYCKCWNWNKILNQKLQIFTCLVNLGSNRIKISLHFTVLLSCFYAQLYLGTVKLCVTYCLKELHFGVCAYLIAFTNFRQCPSSCLESFFRKVCCSYFLELLQFQKVTFNSLNCCLHMLKSSFFRKTEIKGIVLVPAKLQDFSVCCLSRPTFATCTVYIGASVEESTGLKCCFHYQVSNGVLNLKNATWFSFYTFYWKQIGRHFKYKCRISSFCPHIH